MTKKKTEKMMDLGTAVDNFNRSKVGKELKNTVAVISDYHAVKKFEDGQAALTAHIATGRLWKALKDQSVFPGKLKSDVFNNLIGWEMPKPQRAACSNIFANANKIKAWYKAKKISMVSARRIWQEYKESLNPVVDTDDDTGSKGGKDGKDGNGKGNTQKSSIDKFKTYTDNALTQLEKLTAKQDLDAAINTLNIMLGKAKLIRDGVK